MTYRRTLISLLITLGVTTAVFLTLSHYPATNSKKNDATLPDGYMEGVNAVILDKVGKVSMKIVTPKMVHYAEDDKTNFTEPQLTVYHQSPNPWFITSKIATATQGIDNVVFKQDVTIHHPADFNNPATVIKTTTLTVHPNDSTAETTELITMIQPNSIMKAVGMFADMNSGNIKLLSQAKGEYAPDS